MKKNIRQQKVKSFEEEEKSKIAEQAAGEMEPQDDKSKVSKKEKVKESGLKAHILKKINKKLITVVIIAVLAVLSYYFFLYDNVYWELAGATSTVFINGEAAFAGSGIDDGETVLSPGSSALSVVNGSIGRIQAASDASFKIIDDSSLNFISGTYRIFKASAEKCFRAEVPSAIIKDESPGGYYEIEISREGNTVLKNSSGTLIVTSAKMEFIVPPGYECYMNKSYGAGIPYHNTSSEEFRQTLNDLQSSKDEIAGRILTIAQKKDVFTIWNLIRVVSPMKRAELFDFILKHAQVPPSVTKDGIVFLNKNMLDELRKLL